MPHPSGADQDDPTPRTAVGTAPPVVRHATVADAPRLAEINLVTWQTAYAGLVPDAYLASLEIGPLCDRWVTRIEQPGDRVSLLSEVAGQVAAYAIVGAYRTQQDARPEDTTGWGELFAIYTHPDLQGLGAGSAVHDAALRALAVSAYSVAALWVLRDNAPGRRWYGGRGWQPDGASSEWLGSGVPLEEIRLVRSTNGSLPDASSRLGR